MATAAAAAAATAGARASAATTVVILRHGERMDYADPTWMARQRALGVEGRPFDPPLTPLGMRQAALAGEAIAAHLEELGRPQPTRVFTSPFIRCVETATNAAPGVKAGAEPSLSELLSEDWLRSWALPDSDGTWGGPWRRRHEAVDPGALHPLVNDFAAAVRDAPAIGRPDALDEAYVPAVAPSAVVEGLSWPEGESYDKAMERIAGFIRSLPERYPGETVLLVSHGGVLAHAYEHLVGRQYAWDIGYTSCFVYAPPAEAGGAWTVLVDNSHDHVRVAAREEQQRQRLAAEGDGGP